jgi:hypothetical protein
MASTSKRTRWRATLTEDPWNGITAPSAARLANARRVDADLPWNFFWARDIDRRCLLLLSHALESVPRGHLPQLQGIEVADVPGDERGQSLLVLKLMDSGQRDIFFRLCRDLVASTTTASSEKEAVEIALTRTWRWHHLLRGGRDGRLSAEEQKGLIGELLVLERHLLVDVTAADALAAWQGPLRAPKDFEIGRVCIEAKARRGSARPRITMSSEHQLDDMGVDVLFLHVVELDRAPAGGAEGFSLTAVAKRVSDSIEAKDGDVLDLFERSSSRLASAGRMTTPIASGWRVPAVSTELLKASLGSPRRTCPRLGCYSPPAKPVAAGGVDSPTARGLQPAKHCKQRRFAATRKVTAMPRRSSICRKTRYVSWLHSAARWR